MAKCRQLHPLPPPCMPSKFISVWFILTGLDVKERLARQQELLRKRLGMVAGLETGMDIVLDDDDILPAHAVVKKTLEKQKSKDSQVCV